MSSPFVKYVKRFRAALVALIAGSAALAAQAPQSPPAPEFEVASIKPNNSGDGRVMMQVQPGRYMATNVTLRLLIRNAYQLEDFQITGGPSWLASDHFDIIAKMPDGFQPPAAPPAPGSGPGPVQLMLRSLHYAGNSHTTQQLSDRSRRRARLAGALLNREWLPLFASERP